MRQFVTFRQVGGTGLVEYLSDKLGYSKIKAVNLV